MGCDPRDLPWDAASIRSLQRRAAWRGWLLIGIITFDIVGFTLKAFWLWIN